MNRAVQSHRLEFERSLHDRPLPALLAGYGRVDVSPDEGAIRRSAVLLALRQLCRWLTHGHGFDHPVVAQRAARIREVLEHA